MIDVQLVNSLHERAMDCAGRAFHANIHGQFSDAEDLFREAFELERQAAEIVAADITAEPTRSVLLRSAASLALDCREFREAERLVAIGLAGSPPEEMREELRDLLEIVYFSRHLDLRGLELDPIEFQMSLVGGAVSFGVIESGQFLRRAETLETLLFRTAERRNGVAFRETGAPSKKTLHEFEVYFSSSRAASYALTVRLGRPQRQLLMEFPEIVQPQVILDDVLECFKKFESGDIGGLKEQIPDEAYFNNFSALAKRLAPDGQKITTVGFTSVLGEESHIVALTHPPLPVWTPEAPGGETIEVVGRVRIADEAASKRSHPIFGVEDAAGKVTRISVAPGYLQDIVKPFWGEQVRVLAAKVPKPPYPMLEIVAVESEAQAE